MKIIIGFLTFAFSIASLIAAEPPPQEKNTDTPPQWAYPIKPPATQPTSGSAATTQMKGPDPFNIPDPHPDEHPAMAEIVARGRKPVILACGYCHLPNGLGGPQNASLAGLPLSYIVRQMAEFKSGARKSSQPQMGPLVEMIENAKGITDAEVQSAAEYYSGLKRKTWIRVVETDTVPKVRFTGITFVLVPGGGDEAIGNRIVEMAETADHTASPGEVSGFVAYVPKGSVAKGQMLVATGGGGRTVACALCHGPELRGLGSVPPLVGRSPSYIFRQLYDIRHGARNGEWSVLMKAPLAHLGDEDLLAIAAYLASREP